MMKVDIGNYWNSVSDCMFVLFIIEKLVSDIDFIEVVQVKFLYDDCKGLIFMCMLKYVWMYVKIKLIYLLVINCLY